MSLLFHWKWYHLKKSVPNKKSISWDQLCRRNHLKQENTLKLKAVQAKKISPKHLIFCHVINYTVPWNEQVGIIFCVNCSEPAFSQLNSFIFKFTSRVSENCFLTLTKKQAVKLTIQESKSINNIKALLSSFKVGFRFASGFHREH